MFSGIFAFTNAQKNWMRLPLHHWSVRRFEWIAHRAAGILALRFFIAIRYPAPGV